MSETKGAPDAVEILRGAVGRIFDEIIESEEAVLAERQRHAEEVAGLRAQRAEAVDKLQDVRDQLRRVEGERDELRHKLQWAVNERNDLREDLTARRALDADVRVCAERCRDTLIGPPGMPVEDYPLAPEALAARRLLAANFLREPCPECHMVERCKMSCSRGGSKGARISASLREGGE